MYNITSESQLIDTETIKQGCTKIESAAKKYEDCAKEVETAADMCGAEVLSVDKKTMQPIMEELAQEIRKLETNFTELSASIMEIANSIYTQQKNELDIYRRGLEAAKKNKDENNDKDDQVV